MKAWAVSSAGRFYLHDPNDGAQLRPTIHGCGCEGVVSPESLEFSGASHNSLIAAAAALLLPLRFPSLQTDRQRTRERSRLSRLLVQPGDEALAWTTGERPRER